MKRTKNKRLRINTNLDAPESFIDEGFSLETLEFPFSTFKWLYAFIYFFKYFYGFSEVTTNLIYLLFILRRFHFNIQFEFKWVLMFHFLLCCFALFLHCKKKMREKKLKEKKCMASAFLVDVFLGHRFFFSNSSYFFVVIVCSFARSFVRLRR